MSALNDRWLKSRTVLSRLIRGSFNSTFGHFTFCIRIRLIRHIRRRRFIYYALNTRLIRRRHKGKT